MIFRWVVLGMILICSNILPAAAEQLTEEQKEAVSGKITLAVDAAKSWVAIVDSGRYNDSWDNAAQFFKDKVPEGQWETTLRQVREPLGKAVSREVANYQYLTNLPGASKGEYVVIQFKTSFEQKPDSIETITPMLDSDGQWRVSGYYIR